MNNDQTSEIARLQAEIHALQEQNEKLEAWIDDLQSGMYINCVYCGYRYGPNTVSHVTMRKALEDHIASCPKHPLSTAKSALEQARRELAELKKRSGDIAEKTIKQFERYEAELADLRGMIEALQDENKKLKSIAAESIDDAVRAEEENRDLKIRYETIVGDHASSLRFIKSIKADLADARRRLEEIVKLRKKQLRLSCPDCCCDCLDRPDCCPGAKYDALLKIAQRQAIKAAGRECDEHYDCPIHGKQDGPDCPRC